MLSEKRAISVANYAGGVGEVGSRITTIGLGPNEPVVSNDTPEGRQQNKCVEVAISANDKLKDAAENGLIK